jgi:hypothetical protein
MVWDAASGHVTGGLVPNNILFYLYIFIVCLACYYAVKGALMELSRLDESDDHS